MPLALTRSVSAAGATGGRSVVLIRMGGGNDGLNTVIPAEDDRYHRARPTLAVATSDALPLTGPHFLHPALRGLMELFDDGHLAVVQSVGYPSPDRSHFRSMDIWDSGVVDRVERQRGWIGRALAGHDDPRRGAAAAIAITGGELPLALAGSGSVPPALPSVDALLPSRQDLPVQGARRDTYRTPASEFVADVTSGALQISDRLRGLTASAGELPTTGLGRALGTVLDLLRADVPARVYYVPFDGFDTHTRQADQHATLLRELGDAVLGFQKALSRHGLSDRIVLATYSEFGRRVRENGSRGTDHGAAAPLFIAGDAIQGGVIGAPPDLDDLDDGDVRFQTDFRQIYATLLERWLGVESQGALGGTFAPLSFLA